MEKRVPRQTLASMKLPSQDDVLHGKPRRRWVVGMLMFELRIAFCGLMDY
jgi:hypothetical protein